MTFSYLARLSHRKERDNVIDPPERLGLTEPEYLLRKGIRAAILQAHFDGLSKTQIAAVLDHTLREYGFSAKVTA